MIFSKYIIGTKSFLLKILDDWIFLTLLIFSNGKYSKEISASCKSSINSGTILIVDKIKISFARVAPTYIFLYSSLLWNDLKLLGGRSKKSKGVEKNFEPNFGFLGSLL